MTTTTTTVYGGQPVFFDRIAELYEEFAATHAHFYLPWLSAQIPTHLGPDGRAVDLGCGSGRFTTLLADRYSDVLAVDISERGLSLARVLRRHPHIRYEHRSLLDVTPEQDGQFDLVLSVNALHHVGDPDAALAQVAGLVAPGGRAVLVDIVATSRHYPRRWWHAKEGLADAGRTLRRHRSPAAAWKVARLRLHPVWLAHVTTNIPLTSDEFRAVYARRLPGVEFDDTLSPVVYAATWQRPPRTGTTQWS